MTEEVLHQMREEDLARGLWTRRTYVKLVIPRNVAIRAAVIEWGVHAVYPTKEQLEALTPAQREELAGLKVLVAVERQPTADWAGVLAALEERMARAGSEGVGVIPGGGLKRPNEVKEAADDGLKAVMPVAATICRVVVSGEGDILRQLIDLRIRLADGIDLACSPDTWMPGRTERPRPWLDQRVKAFIGPVGRPWAVWPLEEDLDRHDEPANLGERWLRTTVAIASGFPLTRFKVVGLNEWIPRGLYHRTHFAPLPVQELQVSVHIGADGKVKSVHPGDPPQAAEEV